MKSLFQKLGFAWRYFVMGYRPPVRQRWLLPDADYPPSDPTLLEFLKEMYEAHGSKAIYDRGWIVVGNGVLFAKAAYFNLKEHPNNLVLQTDFVTVLKSGHHIVESFAGIGENLPAALKDACQNFQDCTFHPLYAAFLDHSCKHVEKESWEIAGIPRSMTFGWLRHRGHFPQGQWLPIFQLIESQIKASNLIGGLHWFRYFYAHAPGQPPTIEVLLDNDPWTEIAAQAAGLPWPESDRFYSARLFCIVQEATSA